MRRFSPAGYQRRQAAYLSSKLSPPDIEQGDLPEAPSVGQAAFDFLVSTHRRPLLEPGRRAITRAAQGRKAAPVGGPIGTKSGGSITPKSGGPISTKSGGSINTKSSTEQPTHHLHRIRGLVRHHESEERFGISMFSRANQAAA
jgi:hypothetical protein